MNIDPHITNCLNQREVEKRLGIRKSTLYKLINAGEFPGPIRLGTARRWLSTDVDEFLQKLISDRAAHITRKQGGE